MNVIINEISEISIYISITRVDDINKIIFAIDTHLSINRVDDTNSIIHHKSALRGAEQFYWLCLYIIIGLMKTTLNVVLWYRKLVFV